MNIFYLGDYFDKFFSRFSYMSKVFFVFTTGMLAAALVGLQLNYYLKPLIQIVKNENILLERYEAMETMLIDMISEEDGKKKRLADDLAKIKDTIVSAQGTQFSLPLREIEQAITDQKSAGADEILLNLKILQSLRTINRHSIIFQSMTYNPDTRTHLLLEMIAQNLITSEFFLAQIIVSGRDETKNLGAAADKANLLMARDMLNRYFEQIKYLYSNSMNIETAHNQPEKLASLQQLLDDYSHSLFDLDQMILSVVNGEESIAKLTQQSKLAFSNISKLYNGIINEVQETLAIQEDGLEIRWLLGMIILATGMICCLLMYFSQSIRHPIINLREAASQVAKGNLSARAEVISKDEVANMSIAFNRVAEIYETLFKKASAITGHLYISSSGVFSIAKDLETSLMDQEISLQKIIKDSKEISKTTFEFADFIGRSNRILDASSKMAGKTVGNLSEMQAILAQMAEGGGNVLTTLNQLTDKVALIHGVIFSIVKIADQSNLLSINTAIRADKSGASGLGLYVIAEKIRELADQIAEATLDMEKSVKAIIAKIDKTLKEITKFSEQIQTQVTELLEINDNFTNIIVENREQFRVFESISEGAKKQTVEAIDIKEQVNTMVEASKGTADAIKKFYHEIEYLFYAANNLQEMTKPYKDASDTVSIELNDSDMRQP